MSRYIDYFTAGLKVIYDRAADYLQFYANVYDTPQIAKLDSDDDETDYDKYLDFNKYNDEMECSRILNYSTFTEDCGIFFSQPTHIVDNIYVGSAFNAASYYTLKDINVKVIFNITKEISNWYPSQFEYVNFQLYDNNDMHIDEYLAAAYQKILECQEKYAGNILIHCFMGASRSVSIVLYYLMMRKKYTMDQALEFIKSKRTNINPTFRLTKDIIKSVDKKVPTAHTELSDTELSDTELSDTELSDTELSDTKLSDTELSDVKLSDT